MMRTLKVMVLFAVVLISGACRQDMHDQPKYEPYEPSTFFADGRGSRPLVEGTVPRGYLREDTLFYTGKTGQARQAGGATQQPQSGVVTSPAGTTSGALQQAASGADQQAATPKNTNAQFGAEFAGFSTQYPFPITEEVLNRGQERFNIFCSVCHSRTGDGLGMVVRRGYRQPTSFHDERLRQAPPGYIFDVITNGFGAMPDYAAQITPRDRWAIAAYIRALQLSWQGGVADVPPDQRNKLNQGGRQQQGGQGQQR